MKKRLLILSLLTIMLLAMTGCLAGGGAYSEGREANFLMGIWHGWIAPISLILGLFRPGIRIYEMNNTGWWYDFGFYMAVISGFGGLSLSRRKKDD